MTLPLIPNILVRLFEAEDTCPFGPPPIPGVYGVFVKNIETKECELVYIGSSHNVQKRVLHPRHPYIQTYREMDNEVLRVYTKTLEADNYHAVEQVLIKHYQPKLNNNGKKI